MRSQEKLEGDFRYQVIVKSVDRMQLHALVEEAFVRIKDLNINASGIYVDIDPVDLM
jgi:primosomal protein N'